MKPVGVFYGSSTGDTFKVSELIEKFIGPDKVELYDICQARVADLTKYSFLILGISTWGIGKLQEDWEKFLSDFTYFDLRGKKVALFGLGDQESYPDTFADALGILYDIFSSHKCQMLGEWPVEGYDFLNSRSIRNGMFMGLILDERNQPDLTEQRVFSWLNNLGLV